MKPFLFLSLPALAIFNSCSQPSSTPSPDPEVVEEKMIDLQTDFDKHDSNGDGSLSRDELKQTMIKMGARDTSDANVNRVMKFYDFDGDGRISLREAQSGAVSGAEALIETGR